MNREKLLKNLPPMIGLVVMLLAALALRRSFILAIPLGLVAWWGAHVLISRAIDKN